MLWIQILVHQSRRQWEKALQRVLSDKYPLVALSISREPGMTDDLARLPGTNILCFLRARYLSHVIYLECVLLLFIIYRSVHLTCIISYRDTQYRNGSEISETNNAAEFPATEISTYDGLKLPSVSPNLPRPPRRLSLRS